MILQRIGVIVLLSALIALAPLAQASPPDQTWIGGFYDDADYDDVVLLVTGIHAVKCASVPVLLPVSEVVALAPVRPQATPPGAVPLSEEGRAPPLS